MTGLAILLLLFALAGGAAIVFLLRRARAETDGAGTRGAAGEGPPVSAQQLAALAQPYRTLLGEAAGIQQELADRAGTAPPVLRAEITEMAARMFHLLQRALPRARHGTQLAEFLLRLTPDAEEYAETNAEAEKIAAELGEFVEQMRRLRGKVYAILSNAASLQADRRLQTDLDGALSDVQALEEAMSEAVEESAYLP